MAILSLPNGLTMEVNTTLLLSLTDEEYDEEINELMCMGIAGDINDPFFMSALAQKGANPREIEEIEEPEIDESIDFEDITE